MAQRDADPGQGGDESGAQAGEKNHQSSLTSFFQKYVQNFECDGVGVADALQTQDDIADTLLLGLVRGLLQVAFEFRSCGEEQIALKIIDQHALWWRVRGDARAHHAFWRHD